MKIEVLKSKTAMASGALLIVSLLRMWEGDATALQGVQEAIMSIVPILLRSAISSDAQRTAAAVIEAGGDQADQAATAMPAAGDA